MQRIQKWTSFSKVKSENGMPIMENTQGDKGRRALKKMQYCRMQLLKSNPFFGHLGMKLVFTERNDLPYKTMATDGNNLYYDPDFVLGKSNDEIIWVICHEIMHCVLFHFARKMPDPKIWNAACDYALNLLIDPSDPSNKDKGLGKVPEGALLDQKYKGMRSEDIYQFIIDNNIVLPPEEGWNYGGVMPPMPVKSGGGGGGSSSGGGKKIKIGDWVKSDTGVYGKVIGIDTTTGDIEVETMTEKEMIKAAEDMAGKKVKTIY